MKNPFALILGVVALLLACVCAEAQTPYAPAYADVPIYTNQISLSTTNTTTNAPYFSIAYGGSLSIQTTLSATNGGNSNCLFTAVGSIDSQYWATNSISWTAQLNGSNTWTSLTQFTNLPYNFLKITSTGTAQTNPVSIVQIKYTVRQ